MENPQIRCDQEKCPVRGNHVYCLLDSGRWNYKNCFIYNTSLSHGDDLKERMRIASQTEVKLDELADGWFSGMGGNCLYYPNNYPFTYHRNQLHIIRLICNKTKV